MSQVPVQITFRHMPRSDALEALIREKVDKLEEFYPALISCRLVVDEEGMHHHQGRRFNVRIDVHVPGHEFATTREHDEDVYVALRDAFGAVRRRLGEGIRESRGNVKTHETPQHGKVARVFTDEGFGFIQTEDGREFYFSSENVVHPRFEDLGSGAQVQFIEEAAADGAQAKRVSVGKHHF